MVFAKAIGLSGAEKLPDSPEEAEGLAALLATNPGEVKRTNEAAWLAYSIYSRVNEKLRREPVEDFRIDFEDGYGNRPDEEEDGHAASAAAEVAAGITSESLPPLHWYTHQAFH